MPAGADAAKEIDVRRWVSSQRCRKQQALASLMSNANMTSVKDDKQQGGAMKRLLSADCRLSCIPNLNSSFLIYHNHGILKTAHA